MCPLIKLEHNKYKNRRIFRNCGSCPNYLLSFDVKLLGERVRLDRRIVLTNVPFRMNGAGISCINQGVDKVVDHCLCLEQESSPVLITDNKSLFIHKDVSADVVFGLVHQKCHCESLIDGVRFGIVIVGNLLNLILSAYLHRLDALFRRNLKGFFIGLCQVFFFSDFLQPLICIRALFTVGKRDKDRPFLVSGFCQDMVDFRAIRGDIHIAVLVGKCNLSVILTLSQRGRTRIGAVGEVHHFFHGCEPCVSDRGVKHVIPLSAHNAWDFKIFHAPEGHGNPFGYTNILYHIMLTLSKISAPFLFYQGGKVLQYMNEVNIL